MKILSWLFCAAVLLLSATASAAIQFAQVTDPHLFDSGPEADGNKAAMQWCIEQINLRATAGAEYKFVVVTGDIGLEKLAGDKGDPQKALDTAAKEFGTMIAASRVKHWLFLPGNNDLVNEDPKTIGIYTDFVRTLAKSSGDVVVIDLCPHEGDPRSGVYVEETCRFIGFDNASFKSNGKSDDAKRFEAEQLKDVDDVRARLAALPATSHAFLFYHIPELDDPWLAMLDPNDKIIADRAREQAEVGQSNPLSAWTVTKAVRDRWSRVLLDPRLSARFAGHFHTSIRKKYAIAQHGDVASEVTSSLWVCPPVAGKRQQGIYPQARGFLSVSVDCDSGRVKLDPIWYDGADPTLAAQVPTLSATPTAAPAIVGQSASAKAPAPAQPDALPARASVLSSEGMFFVLVFLLLLLSVPLMIALAWRSIIVRAKRTLTATEHATAVVSLTSLGAVMLGFVVLATLAASKGEDASRVVSIGALWALAALAVGASAGFLFGVPRTTHNGSAPRAANSSKAGPSEHDSTAKTNLEEIANWLSKLIVGGTLFQAGNIKHGLGVAGDHFAATIGGQDLKLWGGVGSSSLIYFGLVGFFGGHFLTRLYLIGALRSADEGDRPIVAERTGLTEAQIAALSAAALHIEGDGIEFDLIAKEAADKIVELTLSSLTNWRDIRLWAKAQLSKVKLDLAIEGYQKAIEIVPNDAESRLGYAVALGKGGAAKVLILNQLEAARASLMLSSPRDLRKNTYKSLTYLCLYLKKPENFKQTLKYAREYLQTPDVLRSGGLLINVACAYGQAYAWLATDPNHRVSASDLSLFAPCRTELTQPEQRDGLLAWIASQALDAIKEAIDRNDEARRTIRELMGLAPRTVVGRDDDDLEPFAGLPDFLAAVNGTRP